MGVQIPFLYAVFITFRQILSNEMARSYSKSIFKYLENLHTILHNGCTLISTMISSKYLFVAVHIAPLA